MEHWQGRCFPSFGVTLTDSAPPMWVEETEEKWMEVRQVPVLAQRIVSGRDEGVGRPFFLLAERAR